MSKIEKLPLPNKNAVMMLRVNHVWEVLVNKLAYGYEVVMATPNLENWVHLEVIRESGVSKHELLGKALNWVSQEYKKQSDN